MDSPEDFIAISKSFGSTDKEFILELFKQVVKTLPGEKSESACNALLSVLHGIEPRDPLESQLSVQMISAHNLAMEFLGRAISEGQSIEGTDSNINRATKLMRLYATHMETLMKYRNRGHQQITVQHVQVNGQAIIGTVNQES